MPYPIFPRCGPDVSLRGFVSFLRGAVGIPPQALPDGSMVIGLAFGAAIETVSLTIRTISPASYAMAVYDLATDTLLNVAQDVPGQTFFAAMRERFKLDAFVPGVITSTGDAGTAASLLTPEAFQRLTLANLQQLKTPWGRDYLAVAQSASTIWGLS